MPHWELDAEIESHAGDTPPPKDKEVERLNINVVSIVAGALVVISLMAWISAIKITCEHAIEEDREDRYKVVPYKYIGAFVMTLITIFVIVLLYLYVKGRYW